MVHRPSYPYLVSFEKINLFLVLVLSGSLTISISNFVQWIQSSFPILSYPYPSFFFFLLLPSAFHQVPEFAFAYKKNIFFFLSYPILSYPIRYLWRNNFISHFGRLRPSDPINPELWTKDPKVQRVPVSCIVYQEIIFFFFPLPTTKNPPSPEICPKKKKNYWSKSLISCIILSPIQSDSKLVPHFAPYPIPYPIR